MTAGAHRAIALALGAVAGPGTPVAVENPSYQEVFDSWTVSALAGARALRHGRARPSRAGRALAELAFAGPMHTELADLCRRAVVVSIGSFCKVARGGLRLGWLRGPAPLVERTMHLRLGSDLGPAVPSQLLALQLLPGFAELADR